MPPSISNHQRTAATSSDRLRRSPIDPTDQFFLPSSMEYHESSERDRSQSYSTCQVWRAWAWMGCWGRCCMMYASQRTWKAGISSLLLQATCIRLRVDMAASIRWSACGARDCENFDRNMWMHIVWLMYTTRESCLVDYCELEIVTTHRV